MLPGSWNNPRSFQGAKSEVAVSAGTTTYNHAACNPSRIGYRCAPRSHHGGFVHVTEHRRLSVVTACTTDSRSHHKYALPDKHKLSCMSSTPTLSCLWNESSPCVRSSRSMPPPILRHQRVASFCIARRETRRRPDIYCSKGYSNLGCLRARSLGLHIIARGGEVRALYCCKLVQQRCAEKENSGINSSTS